MGGFHSRISINSKEGDPVDNLSVSETMAEATVLTISSIKGVWSPLGVEGTLGPELRLLTLLFPLKMEG